jgi:hypothetical protein
MILVSHGCSSPIQWGGHTSAPRHLFPDRWHVHLDIARAHRTYSLVYLYIILFVRPKIILVCC